MCHVDFIDAFYKLTKYLDFSSIKDFYTRNLYFWFKHVQYIRVGWVSLFDTHRVVFMVQQCHLSHKLDKWVLSDVWRVDNLIQFTPSNPLDDVREDISGTIDGHCHTMGSGGNVKINLFLFWSCHIVIWLYSG